MGDRSPACLEGTSWENSHHLFPPLPKLGCASSPIIHQRLGIMGGGLQGRRWGEASGRGWKRAGPLRKGKEQLGWAGSAGGAGSDGRSLGMLRPPPLTDSPRPGSFRVLPRTIPADDDGGGPGRVPAHPGWKEPSPQAPPAEDPSPRRQRRASGRASYRSSTGPRACAPSRAFGPALRRADISACVGGLFSPPPPRG